MEQILKDHLEPTPEKKSFIKMKNIKNCRESFLQKKIGLQSCMSQSVDPNVKI